MTISESEATTLAPRLPDGPLVSAQEARQMWEEYHKLESSALGDDDYLWFVWVATGSEGDDKQQKSLALGKLCLGQGKEITDFDEHQQGATNAN